MFVAVSVPPIDNVFYVDLSKKQLDFPDNTFDAVNAYHVLEHVAVRLLLIDVASTEDRIL